MANGERTFNGRHYLLAGRGTKAHCQHEAQEARKRWRYVRVVPWNPYYPATLQAALDDYALFVLEEIQ